MSANLGLMLNEQILINILKEDPSCILRFDRNYFVSKIAQDLFSGIKDCYLSGMELNSNNIIIHGNKLNSLINNELLENLSRIEYNIADFEVHFKKQKTEWAKNLISNKLLKQTLIEVEKKGDLNIEAIESLKNEIVESLEIIEGKESLLINADLMFDRYKEILLNRKNGKNKYPTGDSYLDSKITMGFAPGYMTDIIADSGVGKSILGLNLINKQINKQIPCVYISPENDLGITMDRLCSMRLDIDYTNFYFKDGEENIDILELINEEQKKLKKINSFFFVEESNISLKDVEMICSEAKKKMKSEYAVVTIDLLSMIKEFATDIGPQSIEEYMNVLHRLSKKENVHFVNILQTNGEAANFKPKLVKDCESFRFRGISDIKNGRAYGERARTVIGAYRPKIIASNVFGSENKEVEIMPDLMHLQILKQNQGPLSTVKMLFIPERFKLYPFKEEKKEII